MLFGIIIAISPRYFNGNIANNNWVHLVYSHNGDTLFTYLNGNLDKAEPNTDVLNLNSELSIGKTSFTVIEMDFMV